MEVIIGIGILVFAMILSYLVGIRLTKIEDNGDTEA